MRNIHAGVNRVLRFANKLDEAGLFVYSDILTNAIKRVANDEFMFGGSPDYPDDPGWTPPDEDYDNISMEDLERADFERELFELVMCDPETLSLEERERKLQLMHYLKGNSWDSYKEDPENMRLRKLLGEMPGQPGFMSEAIDTEMPTY